MSINFGSRGAAVAALQSQLTKAGFSTKGVDGIYGNNTENAVQQAYVSFGVQGVSGAATDELLGALSARVGPGDTTIHTAPPGTSMPVGTDLPATGLAGLSTGKKVAIAGGLGVVLLFLLGGKK